MARTLSEEARAVLDAVLTDSSARDVAARAGLSMRAATVHLSRLVNRPVPLVAVVCLRRETGVDQPVPLYRRIDPVVGQASALDALEAALDGVIRARRKILAGEEAGA